MASESTNGENTQTTTQESLEQTEKEQRRSKDIQEGAVLGQNIESVSLYLLLAYVIYAIESFKPRMICEAVLFVQPLKKLLITEAGLVTQTMELDISLN